MSSETEGGEPAKRAITGDEKPRKKRGLPFRIFRVVLGIVLVPIVLVALLLAYLHTDSGKERLRAIVEARLAKKVNGTVQIGSLDLALFGDLTIGGVVIKDAKGEKAIALERVRVRPKWGDLGGPGPIPLEAVEVSGLDVEILKDAEGGSNFKGLFEPIELKKGVSIDDVRISDVNVTIASPDGTKIAVTGVGLEGTILAKSATKTFRVDLPTIGANVAVEKPASGLTVGVRDLKTGLRVDVDAGKGTVELLPLSAEVALAVKPRGIDRTIPVSTGGLKLSLEEATSSVDLEKLAIGLLTLSAVEVRAPMAEGKLAGVPRAEVVGLRVVGKEVNALLGKELLLTDVDIDAHLGGTSQSPTLALHVAAGDARIDVDAKAEDPMGARPRFDVTTTVSNVDTAKIVGSGVTVPPATLESLRIEAKGSGKDLASLSADVKLVGKNARVRGVTVDELGVRASIADGKVDVKEVDVRALDQHVAIAGNLTVASKEVDVKLRLDGDVDSAMAKLRTAGIPISVKLPKNVLVLPKDDLEVGVKGRIDGEMTVTAKAKALRALGAGVAIDMAAKIRRGDKEKGEKPAIVEGFDVHLRVSPILLSTVLALRGRKLPPGFDASFDLKLDATGTLQDPNVKLALTGSTIRKPTGDAAGADKKDLPRLALRLDASVDQRPGTSGHRARIDLVAMDKASPTDVVLRAKAELPLSLRGEKKGLDPAGSIKADIEIPRRPISSIAAYTPAVPIPPFSKLVMLSPILEKPNGSIALAASFDGTVARPKGKIDLDLETQKLAGESTQKLHLVAHVDPAERGATKAGANLTLSLDGKAEPAVALDASADFPTSPLLGGAARMTYDAKLKVGPLPLSSLPPLPQLERVRGLGGTLAATVDVKGNRQDVDAHIDLDATGLSPGQKGPFDVHANIDLEPETTKIAADVDLAQKDLLTIGGTVGAGGKGLLPRAKQGGLDPTLNLTITVPDRPLSSLAVLRPNLAPAPGTLRGKIEVTGTAKEPLANGAIGLANVEMASGAKGGVAAHIAVDKDRAGVSLRLGAADTTKDAVALGTIDVGVPRAALAGYSKGEPLPIDATIAMQNAPIASLVPAFAAKDAKPVLAGTANWNMKAHATLEKKDDKTKVKDAAIDGQLLIAADKIQLPGTRRVYEKVKIDIAAEKGKVTVRGIEAHESDRDVKDRALRIGGELTLDNVTPTHLDLRLSAHKWLLFGTATLGKPDAPRGTLDLEATARMELDRSIRVATVDIKKLDASFPDRFERAHQPEDVHAGDVFFVDDKTKVGKLPAPPPQKLPDSHPHGRELVPTSPAPPPAADPAPEAGMDVEIRIAKGARLLQSPLELHPHGTIAIKVRPSGRTVKGQLVMEGGELSLGGKMHPLRRGTLTFDEKAPSGWLDLWFKKDLPPWALRNISKKSGGDGIEIHMFGPIADRRTVLAGAGPGALFDLLSEHNVGRERFYAEPDLPESEAVEFPQHMGLLTLSFLSVNLPHLLFLDRVLAWNDPTDAPRSYGQLDHYEGDRYFAEGTGRVRATRRPPDVGRSEAEVEALYLFENSQQLLIGIGGAAGSRGGGGPGVVLEWSSER